MSLEQNLSPLPTTPSAPAATSVIENEFPTYRAVSPHAVLALAAGLLSIFSIVHSAFLLCALVAVVLGIYAVRKIQHHSDMLTGLSIAQTGVTLGLIFGLGTLTVQLVQSQIRRAEAAVFAKQFVGVLKTGTLDDAIWFKQPPVMRADKSAAEVVDALRKSMREPQMFAMEFSSLMAMKERIDGEGGDVHFRRIEETGTSDLNDFAMAVIEIHGAATKDHPETEQHALLFVKSSRNIKTGKNEWWVDTIKYPYIPNTFVAPSKPVDDGHGHGAGGH